MMMVWKCWCGLVAWCLKRAFPVRIHRGLESWYESADRCAPSLSSARPKQTTCGKEIVLSIGHAHCACNGSELGRPDGSTLDGSTSLAFGGVLRNRVDAVQTSGKCSERTSDDSMPRACTNSCLLASSSTSALFIEADNWGSEDGSWSPSCSAAAMLVSCSCTNLFSWLARCWRTSASRNRHKPAKTV